MEQKKKHGGRGQLESNAVQPGTRLESEPGHVHNRTPDFNAKGAPLWTFPLSQAASQPLSNPDGRPPAALLRARPQPVLYRPAAHADQQTASQPPSQHVFAEQWWSQTRYVLPSVGREPMRVQFCRQAAEARPRPLGRLPHSKRAAPAISKKREQPARARVCLPKHQTTLSQIRGSQLKPVHVDAVWQRAQRYEVSECLRKHRRLHAHAARAARVSRPIVCRPVQPTHNASQQHHAGAACWESERWRWLVRAQVARAHPEKKRCPPKKATARQCSSPFARLRHRGSSGHHGSRTHNAEPAVERLYQSRVGQSSGGPFQIYTIRKLQKKKYFFFSRCSQC